MTPRDPTAEAAAETEDEGPVDFHIIRVEVTVAAAIQKPDNHILGNNMVDCTVSFGWRAPAPPDGISDAEVNAALSKQLPPVLALIQTVLTLNGWVAMGQVDTPMTENSRATGERVVSDRPVTVHVRFPDEGAMVHD